VWTLEDRRALRDRRPEALERFYESWFDRLYGYVRRLVRDEHLAEDLTQDVFLHLQSSLGSYDPTRALRPWVYTIATNKVRDWWNSRRGRERSRELSTDSSGADDGAPQVLPDERRGPDDHVAARELSARVRLAIEEMPSGLRTTLLLRYFEGLSFEEIGGVVQRSEVAVRKRYSRALGELRDRLADLDPDLSSTPSRAEGRP
jgi:RNA polymerase sigma-70 factor (ECF subfamily)